ncbi:hypothetical protein ACYSNU_17725 [Enterococcus sp. LJL120]
MSYLNMELSREEIERIFEYLSEGIDDYVEYHEQHEGTYEFDSALKARFENALWDVSKFDED